MAATSRGIDVSDNNGTQNWKTLAAGGVTFAMVKASEGEHTHDPKYATHMAGLRSAGIMPMGYHFAWPNQDAVTEANNYIAAVKGDADEAPGFVHWLDLEEYPNGGKNYAGRSAAQIRAYATAWIERVRAAFPHQRVGVYTSGSDISAGHYPANSDALWYPAYPAGALSYTQAEQRTRPAPSGRQAFAWQFTSTPIDRSIIYMTPAALRAWAGQEDDMPLTDADVQKIAKAVWALDIVPASRPPYQNSDYYKADGKTIGNGTWAPTYALQTNTEAGRQVLAVVKALAAQVGSLSGAVGALAHDGGITAEQVQAAAEAGAAAALAQLGTTLAEQTPAAAG